MAIQNKVFPLFETYLNNASSILELGNQEFEGGGSVKSFCEQRKKTHVSIDITGRDRSLPINLALPSIPLATTFDLVTNFGTSEHIDDSQFYPFKHMHNLCRQGGVMLHEVPVVGHWPNHCIYYYSEDFFSWLAERNNYNILEMKRINYPPNGDLLFVALKKIYNNQFANIQDEIMERIHISQSPVRVNEYWKQYL